jgi:glucose-1-phosphate thymidylyltransferase
MYDHFEKIRRDLLIAIQVNDKAQLQKLAVATLDSEGKVLRMVEKPQEPESETAIYATYFYLKETLPLILKYLQEGNTPDAPGNFPAWLYTRQDVYAYLVDGNCIDIGMPENYKDVTENFPALCFCRKVLPSEK